MSGRGGREGERAATLTSFWKFVFINSTDWFFFICMHTLKSLNMFHRDNFNRFSFSSIHFSLSLLIFRFYNYINFIFNAINQFIIYLKEERRKKIDGDDTTTMCRKNETAHSMGCDFYGASIYLQKLCWCCFLSFFIIIIFFCSFASPSSHCTRCVCVFMWIRFCLL